MPIWNPVSEYQPCTVFEEFTTLGEGVEGVERERGGDNLFGRMVVCCAGELRGNLWDGIFQESNIAQGNYVTFKTVPRYYYIGFIS
jgi:hypothetical protein